MSNAVGQNDSQLPLIPTNRQQFAKLAPQSQTLLLYVRPSDDDRQEWRFDARNDRRLYELFALAPFGFSNSTHLSLYESLNSRPHYELRVHPAQDELRLLATAEVPPDQLADVVFFVYSKRTRRRQQRATVFDNAVDGIDTPRPTDVILFTQYSFTPQFAAQPVWFREEKRNANIGVVGMLIGELL